MTGRQSRAERAATPLARDSIRKIAESVGGCLRPVQLRRTDTVTGQTMPVMVPCGATRVSICPPCAERAKVLRMVQCREGWHLEDEPDLIPGPPDEMQEFGFVNLMWTHRSTLIWPHLGACAAGCSTLIWPRPDQKLAAGLLSAGSGGMLPSAWRSARLSWSVTWPRASMRAGRV